MTASATPGTCRSRSARPASAALFLAKRQQSRHQIARLRNVRGREQPYRGERKSSAQTLRRCDCARFAANNPPMKTLRNCRLEYTLIATALPTPNGASPATIMILRPIRSDNSPNGISGIRRSTETLRTTVVMRAGDGLPPHRPSGLTEACFPGLRRTSDPIFLMIAWELRSGGRLRDLGSADIRPT